MTTETLEFFRQRSYQRGVREAYNTGKRRFCCLWHRRAGKDRNALSFCLERMLSRVGVYFHIFPALNQGRRDLWDNVVQEKDLRGGERSVKMTDMFPAPMVRHRDDKEMQIELFNGSLYQIMGCDDLEAVQKLRGPNPIGLIFSEYAHGPYMEHAWDTLTPVLAENDGWAMFIYTPEGFNHGHKLWQIAIENPQTWYAQLLTIEDTKRDAVGEDGSPVTSIDKVNEFRKHQREEFIQQEYWCSFTGFQHGTIYGDLMMQAEKDGRIRDYPYMPTAPVGVLFDLGKSDAMAMWFYQRQGNATHFIDYVEATQKNMQWAARVLREERQYMYGRIVLPWDGAAAAEYLGEIGFRNVNVCERTASVQASIERVRREFSTFYFDKTKCSRGIECLRNYARKWDDEDKVFSTQPVHDQWSHGCDSLRTGIEGGLEPLVFPNQHTAPLKVEMDFDPRSGTLGVV